MHNTSDRNTDMNGTLSDLGIRTSILLFALLSGGSAFATPPDYATFEREQRVDYEPNEDELLRIWMVFVGQGDGLIIQLPTTFNYDPDPEDGDDTLERVDILIDGGSNPASDAHLILDFLEELYPGDAPIVEHLVISHHDQDHVAGATLLLEQGFGTFGTVYHPGLASFKAGAREFPHDSRPQDAVFKFRSNRLQRGMAFVGTDGTLQDEYIIDDIDDLRATFDDDELHGIYENLAAGVLWRSDGDELHSFDRACVGRDFIAETEADLGNDLDGLQFEVIWPQERLKPYGGLDWGETINGNSVTFRLTYGDFQMLFTGDHNEHSEEALLHALELNDELDLLNCDVLKVPHHGSSHALEDFFRHPQMQPVISVASMGEQGFKSKAMSSRNWQHPSTDVIDWLGGHHRVYCTFVHEKYFRWPKLNTETKRREMIELSNILIETDGSWFRVVELPLDWGNLDEPPTVQQTRRSNGTRWIRSKEED